MEQLILGLSRHVGSDQMFEHRHAGRDFGVVLKVDVDGGHGFQRLHLALNRILSR